MIQDTVTGVLLLSGVGFVLLAALGALRFEDYLTRMAAVSKASTLGLTLIFLAVTAKSWSLSGTIKATMTITILWLTTPIATHLLGRSGLISGERINPKTKGIALINKIK